MWTNGYAILVYLIPSAYLKPLLSIYLVRIPSYYEVLLNWQVKP